MDPAFEVIETRIPTAKLERSEPVLAEKPVKEGTAMSSTSETPPGGFPKSIHGYNVGVVDDYLRKINSRVEDLLSQVQTESSRADQSKRLLEQMTSELETVRRRASEAERREITALEGQKQAQDELVKLSQELKESREKARIELESALADARQERDTLIAEERQDAEALVAEARKSAAAQAEEANRVIESLRAEIARLKEGHESSSAGAPASAHAESDHSRTPLAASAEARLEAEMEAHRAYARSQIDLMVSEARSGAEQASEQSIAIFREQEKRVRALGDECEALVMRIKESIEAQLGQLPAPSARPNAASGHASLRNELPEDKRIREKSDWRSGNWRNAS